MLLLAVALVAADSAWFGLLVLYTTQVLQLPAATYGVLVAAGAAGGLLGALMTDRATRWLGRGRVFVGSVVLAAVTQIVLGLTASAALTVVLLALSSAAFAAYNVVSTSVRQQLVPSSLAASRAHTAPAPCRLQRSVPQAVACSPQRWTSRHPSSSGSAAACSPRRVDPPDPDRHVPRIANRCAVGEPEASDANLADTPRRFRFWHHSIMKRTVSGRQCPREKRCRPRRRVVGSAMTARPTRTTRPAMSAMRLRRACTIASTRDRANVRKRPSTMGTTRKSPGTRTRSGGRSGRMTASRSLRVLASA